MDQRDQFIEYIKKTLMGPRNGNLETLPENDEPADFYTTGILFPQGEDTDRLEEEHPDTGDAGSRAEEDINREDPISLSNSSFPSSAGLSFFLSGSSKFTCEISGARYERDPQKSNWRRVPLPKEGKSKVVTVEVNQQKIEVFDGLAYLNVVRRPCAGGEVITVAIVNNKKTVKSFGRDSRTTGNCLFQLRLRVKPGEESAFQAYQQQFNSLVGEEEQELALLYRDLPTYAIGHGCSANWDLSMPNPSWIEIDFIPTVDVMGITHDLKYSNSNEKRLDDKSEILKFDYLIHAKADEVASGLEIFIDGYKAWISDHNSEIQSLDAGFKPAAQKVIDRLNETVIRMKAGADLISNDRNVRDAFRIANRAMKLHMEKSHVVNQSTQSSVPEKWRPFQLAFILNILPSLVDEQNVDRDIVDLIWFPTGGGKTEAYFGTMAFEIALRRIRYGDAGNGTAIISRYTLTLLVNQQFQRTASLVCALEWLRRNGFNQQLGESPITLGLWIGRDHTPNTIKRAKELDRRIRDGDERELVIPNCPWCGTRIIPETIPGHGSYGWVVEENESYIRCMKTECYFSDRLFIQFVDEMLYEDPPTILMGTVDKFVQLAWNENGHCFFGSDEIRPPGLIIQDEMHLLSGPVGTMFGIYEAGLETVIRLKNGNPKIIAATATIRDAATQSKELFGRDARVFPPPGLNHEDSYFARADKSTTRKYVGLMSPHSTGVTSLIRSVATLSQGPVELPFTAEYLDGYWTQVVFHNSLRELGNFLTYCEDDIPDRIKVISEDQANLREIHSDNVLQVSSNIPNKYEALSQMQIAGTDPGSKSIVACSNMFSAGVDIPRLALMLVNGQPKSVSEYIQATSRIGRGEVPGIVVAHFSASKARDRSHYESFVSFHRSFYRYVEPTSVTSMSMPARHRGLHAAFVIAVRIGLGIYQNNSASSVLDRTDEVMNAFNELLNRCIKIDKSYSLEVKEDLKNFKKLWYDLAEEGEKTHFRLAYTKWDDSNNTALLKTFGADGEGRETQTSLRNIDKSVKLQVRKGEK